MIKASDPSTSIWARFIALSAVSIIPLVIVYLVFSRFIIKGVTAGAVKG
jgi:ABC-type glycerol-3-phosphate transport system permease component